MFRMPGANAHDISEAIPEMEAELRTDIEKISVNIGERNSIKYEKLCETVDFLTKSFETMGYNVKKQEYLINKKKYYNLEVEIKGNTKADEIVIIGAHYDSAVNTPGANDNASGMAGVLSLARTFYGKQIAKTLRFVGFVNEEPPYSFTPQMGSWVYAKRCHESGENVVAMISLETIGYYSDEKGSQNFPLAFLKLFYPDTGNFIGFVGDNSSRDLVQKVVGLFREAGKIPSEGVATFSSIPGIGWSDHWSFWQEGYKALMVTDTAPFRYPYYHTKKDTSDKIDYKRMALVVKGLQFVIEKLVSVN